MNTPMGITTELVTGVVDQNGDLFPTLRVTFYYEPGHVGCMSGPADNWEAPKEDYWEVHEVEVDESGEVIYLTEEEEERLISKLQQMKQG